MNNKKSPIKVLCARVPRTEAGEASELLYRMGASVCLSMLGLHTKDFTASNILGFNQEECTILLSLVPTEHAHEILTKFCDYFDQMSVHCVVFVTNINAISRDTLNQNKDLQNAIQQIFIDENNAKSVQNEVEPQKEGK